MRESVKTLAKIVARVYARVRPADSRRIFRPAIVFSLQEFISYTSVTSQKLFLYKMGEKGTFWNVWPNLSLQILRYTLPPFSRNQGYLRSSIYSDGNRYFLYTSEISYFSDSLMSQTKFCLQFISITYEKWKLLLHMLGVPQCVVLIYYF